MGRCIPGRQKQSAQARTQLTAWGVSGEKSQRQFVCGWDTQVKQWSGAEGEEAEEPARPAPKGIWGHATCNATK